MSTAQSFGAAERSANDGGPKCTPAELLLRVVLAGTLTHYETRGMIDDKRLEHMLLSGKQILYKSHQESEVRYEEAIFLHVPHSIPLEDWTITVNAGIFCSFIFYFL